MAKNNVDIELLAGLSIDSSEAEILKAIKIIEKRLKANHDARFKLNVDIDETVIRNTVEKLQNILKGKELNIDTKSSIIAISKEVDAMGDIVTVARKAANEKIEFAKANERVRNSADDTADAVNRERNAMESMDDVETILNGINNCGRNGNSVFQRFGSTLQEAFSAYTTVNLLERGLNKVVDAGKEAIEVIKEFDDINVDLQLASGEDKGYVKQLINDYSELGSELGALTQTVAESSDTFLRQGRSISETNQLIEDSIILSKVAKTDGEKASEILTATINGFQLAASEGSRVNDVLSSIDLNSASSAQSIGTALTKVASMANSAGISLEKTASMAAVLKDTTQDADETIGVSIKTMLSRMNQIRAGKFVDEETGEALNDVEKVLNKIGISMRDNITGQFKESEVIIDEIGRKWSAFDENSKKAAQFALGGAYQANKVVALFDNYEKVLELTNIAENSAGQALEKFNESYLPSLEAKTQALQNSLQQLYTTTISDDLYASVLDVSKEVVDLTTETGILKSALAGIGVGGSLYAFSQLATYMREAAQGFSNFSNALNMVNRGAITTADDMQTLVDLSHGLSNSQMRLLLSTNNLTDAQKISLMVANGVEQELAEQQLRTWGLINAQNTMTGVTATLTSTVRGFIATLAANQIVLVTMAVTAGVTAFNKYKQAQEEVIQTAREAATVYKDTADTVDDYVAKYKELHKALLEAKGDEEETYSVKQQLLTLQTELNERFTNEADKINIVTDAYKNQVETIKELSKVSANEFLNSNREGIEKANKEMNREKTYQLGSMDGLVNADELDILEQIKAIAESNGINFTNTGFEFVGNANEATDAINNFMNAIKELQTESGKTSEVMSNIFDGLLDSSSDALGEADSIIDKYGDIYEQAQMATIATDTNLSKGYNDAVSAVEAYNEAVLKSENPYDDENVKKAWDNLQTVKNGIQENEEEWGQYSNIMDNVFDSANDKVYSFYDALKNDNVISGLAEELRGLSDIEIQSMANDGTDDAFDKLVEKAKAYGLEIQDVIDLLIELGVVQGQIVTTQEESAISISDVFSMEDAQKNATLLSDYKDQLLEIESAYQTCLSAKEEYDKQGYLSIDTLQKVLSLGDDYLQYLFDEQGNVKLDAEGFKQLTLARINDMEAQALNNLAQNIKQITDEATATKYLADKQNELASSYVDVAAGALMAMTTIDGFTNSKALQGAYQSFKAQYEQIKGLFASTRKGLDSTYSGVSSKATEDAEKATKEYIDSYMAYMEESLNSGRIDYKTYTKEVSAMLKGMYDDGKLAAKDYHTYTKQMLETQKDVMDAVVSAVTYRLDKEIKSYQDQIESVEERYESEIEYLDTVIKYYEDQKKALQDNNDEIDRQLALEQAIHIFERAQSQKTKKLYTAGKGVVYTTDTEAVRNASDEVRKAKLDIEIAKLDDAIEKVEQQQEALKDAMDKEKEALQEIIDRLEDYRDKWEEIAKEYEIRQNEMLAQQILGADWESQILSGRLDVLNSFRDSYLSIQQAIADAAWNSAKAQVDAQQYVRDNTPKEPDAPKTKPLPPQETITTTKGAGNNKNLHGQHHTIMKYASGTDNAKRGIHEVSENGDEVIIDNYGNAMVAKGHQLHYFEGGEIVKSASESKELIKNNGHLISLQSLLSGDTPIVRRSEDVLLGNMSDNFKKLMEYTMEHPIIPNYVQNFSAPKLDYSQLNKNTGTTISIGDIHLHEVQNVDTFADAIIREFPGKVLQAIHRR